MDYQSAPIRQPVAMTYLCAGKCNTVGLNGLG